MSIRKIFHCIVDDTALITNISEIENWVSQGAITLVVPLHTLTRLHILKKDASQLGTNARKAVKFLDRITSGKDGLPPNPVVLQGPEDEYSTWSEVEKHFADDEVRVEDAKVEEQAQSSESVGGTAGTRHSKAATESAGGALSQLLLSKLNFAKDPTTVSPNSTPPTSPATSGPQSSKTSPEVKSAVMTSHDKSPTPPALKSLINFVVWYTYEKKVSATASDAVFLTNSADTANLVRQFAVSPKNVHQLRAVIGMEEQELKNQDKYQKTHPTPPATAVAESEPKPLFRYEDDESDEEVVVFKPRGRGSRGPGSSRGSPTSLPRGQNVSARSPVRIFSALSTQSKPQVPTEEIDPDSFDRGGFGRGSVPLVNTSNHTNGPFQGFPRGPSNRGGFATAGPSRGYRGASRGLDRGSLRGRGRLFVP